MPSTTFNFNKNNFTDLTPKWSIEGEYSKGLRFNTVTKTLQLDNENYKKIPLAITFSGDFDFGSVHLSTPNDSLVSLGEEEDKLYLISNLPQNPAELVFKDENSTTSPKTYYAIVNGDPDKPTSLLNVSIALAKEGSIPNSNISVTLNYNCDYAALYEYETGLHVYSPYDSKSGSARLTTKLYSSTAITSWGAGTKVYSSPYFSNPALPYYYGYNGKVYRVGDNWSRSYGVKFKHKVRVKKRLFKSAKITRSTETIGPFESLKPNGGGTNKPTSEACIEPLMKNVGIITQVIDNDSSLDQPIQYRYYLGYNSSNKRSSNDSVFTSYNFGKKKHYPITGMMHSLQKFTRGIISGYDTRLSIADWAGITSTLGLGALFFANAFGSSGIIAGTFKTLMHFFFACGCQGAAAGILGSSAGFLGTALVGILTAIVIIGILYALWKLFTIFFKPKTYTYQEDCKEFLHHFTTGSDAEYIFTGDVLHRDTTLEEVNNGYYCDGVYYYTQTGGSITTKELSSTNAVVDNQSDPPKFDFVSSIPADDPTLVEEWVKLILLPYCSGKPEPYCGAGNPVYYSPEYTHTIDPHCCDLEICEPKVITLPASSSTSCISQADANAKGLDQISSSISYSENYGVFTQPLDDSLIGQLEVNFTHEIKQEDIPTEVTLYFDNRSGSDAPVGTPLYYDFTGCQKALPGYYATSGSIYPKYYYKVADGKVTDIYTQSAAASTTVSPGSSPIVTTNTGSSSNWYLKSSTKSSITSYISYTDDRTFNVNSLFTSSPYTLSAGHIISGSYSSGSFQKYANYDSNGITSETISEQGTGWYIPLNDWKPEQEDAFYYQNSLTPWSGGSLYATSQSAICTSPLGTTRYHDGEDGAGSDPNLGDRIYNTDNIEDPTGDGFIKFSSGYYLQVVDGVVSNIISCTPSTDFSGSYINSGSRVSYAKARSTNERLYTHNGSSSTLAVGDTISYYGSSAVGAGFIRYQRGSDIYIAHTDSNGVVLQLFNEDTAGAWPVATATLTVGSDGIGGTGLKGYNTTESPTTGGGGYSNNMGDLQYKFALDQEGNFGWKTTGVFEAVTNNGGGFYTVSTYLIMKYPADVNKPTTYWESLTIKDSSNNITNFSITDAQSITNFVEDGERFYVWEWREITSSTSSPFGTTGTTAAVYFYEEQF